MTIEPVPRELKSRVRQLLIEDGLPRLRAWLLSTPTPQRGDVPDYRKFMVSYNESADTLAYAGG